MLKIKIAAVGKIKERALSELTGEYIKRLGRYCAPEVIEIPDEAVSARESGAGILRHTQAEAERILARVKAEPYVVALDIKGAAPDSAAFAENLRSLALRYPAVTFVIGGSNGLHPSVIARADYIMSMSNMTFPHQLARLVLLEQLYRAFKIINNETYHK